MSPQVFDWNLLVSEGEKPIHFHVSNETTASQTLQIISRIPFISADLEPDTRAGIIGKVSWTPKVTLRREHSAVSHFAAIRKRISLLRELTEKRGDKFEEKSADQLIAFCCGLGMDIKPAVFVLLNGQLRALWENKKREQIGLRFASGGQIKFVMFRLQAGTLIETMGTELNAFGIKQRVDNLRLHHLWSRG